jgi:hypothetical protein
VDAWGREVVHTVEWNDVVLTVRVGVSHPERETVAH